VILGFSLNRLGATVRAFSWIRWLALCGVVFVSAQSFGQSTSKGAEAMSFAWPEGKRAAVSLSFDDARLSQVDTGLAVLKKKGVKVTFYVLPSGVEQRLAGWKQAVADGHEIANHSLTHPCTGNYEFSRNNALENYDLAKITQEIDGASEEIYKQLGVKPRTFAYPCGQKFVGRGAALKSYVPLVAERFVAGRGYMDESPNDPVICDLAQTMGTVFDDMVFAAMKKIVDQAVEQGRWVIFVGHEIGPRAYQTTDTKALEALCDYLTDAHSGVWVGTVAEVSTYLQGQRAKRAGQK